MISPKRLLIYVSSVYLFKVNFWINKIWIHLLNHMNNAIRYSLYHNSILKETSILGLMKSIIKFKGPIYEVSKNISSNHRAETIRILIYWCLLISENECESELSLMPPWCSQNSVNLTCNIFHRLWLKTQTVLTNYNQIDCVWYTPNFFRPVILKLKNFVI